MSKNDRKKGFTLIELLVVMAIIGTLATLFVANFNAARQRARDAQRKSDLHNIQTALRLYKNDVGNYPCSTTTFLIRACGNTTLACASVPACTWGAAWQSTTVTYMKELPSDPLASRSYRYTRISSDDYDLEVCLENRSDDACIGNATWCTTAQGCIYRVEP